MKKKIGYRTTLLILALIFFYPAFSQVAVNEDGSSPTSSAMLEVKSTSKGFLPPRMTTAQRDGISSPASGLVIYNTDYKGLNLFDGTKWTSLSGGFVCGLCQVADAEGHQYGTIQIGDQCWMTSNMNTGTRININTIPSDNGMVEKYCYEDNESNCSTYGAYYSWNEAMQYVKTPGARGICPAGWRIPTTEDLQNLREACGGSLGGGELKEQGTLHWYSPNNGATNSTGFTALGAGWVHDDGASRYVDQFHYRACFWSSTWYMVGDPFADLMLLHNDNTSLEIDGRALNHVDGMSVRCLHTGPEE